MLIFVPRMAFNRVDFPEFVGPTIATKPDRKELFVSVGKGISWYLKVLLGYGQKLTAASLFLRLANQQR